MKNARLFLAIHKLLGKGHIKAPTEVRTQAKPSGKPEPVPPHMQRAQRRHIAQVLKQRERLGE